MRIKSRHTVGFLCAEMYTSTMLKNLSFKQVLFAVLGVLLTVLTFTDMPQSIEFACWMFGLAFTSSFQKFFSRFPAIWAFFMVGFGVGLLTELGAILGSLSIPAGERVLLAQDPVTDLLFGVFYYGLLMLTWVWLVRRYSYGPKEIFFITGLLGLATEEVGQVFLRFITNPISNLPYTLIVMSVYGIFPYLAALFTAGRIRSKYPSAGWLKRFFVAAFALFIFIAVFGNFLLPPLREIFGS